MMTMRAGLGERGDRGSATVEIVLWGPVLAFVLLAAFWLGRYVMADFAVEEVASNAARAASIAPDAATAQLNAQAAAEESVAAQDLRCLSLSVDVDVAEFATPIGLPAAVSVDVTCIVDNRDLVWEGIPGNPTLSASAVSPLDQYRSR